MCGRFTQSYTWAELTALYRLTIQPQNLEPHYNIAPTDTVDAVIVHDGGPDPVMVEEDRQGGPRDLQCVGRDRLNEADVSLRVPVHALRHPGERLFRVAANRDRQAAFTSAAGGGVLSFAGLWDRWKDKTGEPVLSCTIIVTQADGLTRPVHDRMPVLLDPDHIGPWLSGEAGTELLKPARDNVLRMWPVSRRVNKTGGADDPGLIEKVALANPGQVATSAVYGAP